MPTILINPPAFRPVSLEDLVKVHIKVSGTSEDLLLSTYLDAAIEDVEDYINRQLMHATYELQISSWSDCLFLVKTPLVSIVSVKYDDESNAEQTIDPLNYYIEGSLIRFVNTDPLPRLYNKNNSVRIRYVAGYGAEGADEYAQSAAVPARAKIGILRTVADFYENRQDQITGVSETKLTNSTEKYLHPLRLYVNTNDLL